MIHIRSEALRRAQERYRVKNVPISFQFQPKRDFRIIKKIKSQPNQTDYIRELVLRDMRAGIKPFKK